MALGTDQACKGDVSMIYPCVDENGQQQTRAGRPCAICATGVETVPANGCAAPEMFCATGALQGFPQSCSDLCD